MIDFYDVVARGEKGGGCRVIDLSLRLSIHLISRATLYFVIYSVIFESSMLNRKRSREVLEVNSTAVPACQAV